LGEKAYEICWVKYVLNTIVVVATKRSERIKGAERKMGEEAVWRRGEERAWEADGGIFSSLVARSQAPADGGRKT
jgi:hypothetical protein